MRGRTEEASGVIRRRTGGSRLPAVNNSRRINLAARLIPPADALFGGGIDTRRFRPRNLPPSRVVKFNISARRSRGFGGQRRSAAPFDGIGAFRERIFLLAGSFFRRSADFCPLGAGPPRFNFDGDASCPAGFRHNAGCYYLFLCEPLFSVILAGTILSVYCCLAGRGAVPLTFLFAFCLYACALCISKIR